MTLHELYPLVRTTHISLVMVSGALFAVRGVAVLLGARWAMATVLRRLSYTIDTGLLGAALMLLAILNLNPFAIPWRTPSAGLVGASAICTGVAAFHAAKVAFGRLVLARWCDSSYSCPINPCNYFE